MKVTLPKLGKIGLSASRTLASKGPAASAQPPSTSKQSTSKVSGWRKKLLSFRKQRKTFVSVAPAPEPVSKATVRAGWERKSRPVEAGKKKAMSAPNQGEEGVEEMETDMSPEPNGKCA